MLFPGVSAVIGLATEELVSMLSADEDAARAARVSAVLVSACLAMDFIGIGLELLIPEYVNIAGPFQEEFCNQFRALQNEEPSDRPVREILELMS
eukprot:jgi/Botrbrau1/12745/Bobra.67_1s0104.1